MLKSILQKLVSKDLPDWFRLLNIGMLLLILLWPFVLFMSIFLFDKPGSDTLQNYLLFIGINAYPVYLLLLLHFNTKLFHKNRLLGAVLPLLIAAAAVILFLLIRFDAYL